MNISIRNKTTCNCYSRDHTTSFD